MIFANHADLLGGQYFVRFTTKYFHFGFSDFAGSGIVHLAGAAAALAGVLLLGARKGKYGKQGREHY